MADTPGSEYARGRACGACSRSKRGRKLRGRIRRGQRQVERPHAALAPSMLPTVHPHDCLVLALQLAVHGVRIFGVHRVVVVGRGGASMVPRVRGGAVLAPVQRRRPASLRAQMFTQLPRHWI